MNASLRRTSSLLLTTMVLCAGCATQAPVRHVTAAQHTLARIEHAAQLSPQQEELLQQLCPFGQPKHQSNWEHGFTELVVHQGYALEHSGNYKIPLWVCERMDPSQLDGPFERKNDFRVDPDLTGPRSELSDYAGSGYHRGHHAPAEDFSSDKQRMSESFFLSNMSPQTPALNSGAWAKLEARARRWVAEDRVTWIITGALIYDPAEDTQDADGWINYYTIGSAVAIPTHLFKIVIGEDAAGNVSTTAYVLPNTKLPAGYNLDDYRKSVRWIEERSGFDFMPDLEPGDSTALEGAVGNARSQ